MKAAAKGAGGKKRPSYTRSDTHLGGTYLQTAVAADDCSVAVFRRKDLFRSLSSDEWGQLAIAVGRIQTALTAKALRERFADFFVGFSESELDTVASYMYIGQTLFNRATIISEGEVSPAIYFVVRGSLNVLPVRGFKGESPSAGANLGYSRHL